MRNRSQLALGFILILLGAWFIAQRQFPEMNNLIEIYLKGELKIVAIGALIFFIGLLVGAPGMAIPAAIVSGIGGILYYQQKTGDYTSWSYMWALIPGFVGVGEILTGLLSAKYERVRSGANTIVVSAVLFIVFGAIFNKLAILGPYGPAILLILLGFWMLVRGLWRKKSS